MTRLFDSDGGSSSGLSFVLCCHNSARRLAETLGHLAAQRVPAGVEWEVVLVDNASSDGTAAAARQIWGAGPAPLRVVEEPRVGLSWARLAGARAARYEAFTLVDDDNWLAPDWLAVALDTLRSQPAAGAIGGQSTAVFEAPAPAWFPAIASSFAIGQQAEASGDITGSRGYLWGAGLTVRREAWRELLAAGFEFFLEDRSGKRLKSGGDTEICHALNLRGWRLYYESALGFRHFIPRGRLAWRYSRRLYRSFGEASVVLDTYRLALRERDHHDVAEEEYRWRSRMSRARQELLRYPRHLARALVRAEEGSFAEHAVEYARGRFVALLRARRRLGAVTARIRALAARPLGAARS